MANSYENTKMPEKQIEQIKPDAIPVDDKGQPLPDPTESLSSYIAPRGVEELKKAYSEVEVDEDIRKTMEPPQKTGLLRKHRLGQKGYDYYGTPAGSVPNDGNGVKPSPLSELFSEAEALEPDFDLEKIREHVLNQDSEGGLKVVETPKLDSSAVKNKDGSDKKSDDDILRKTEVVKDPNTPKFLDMYKQSTNTRVIYQSDEQGGGTVQPQKSVEETQKLFAEHSQVAKVRKRLSKREEKKALKAAIKAEKKAAKERRKAEKAARKAAKKAARKGNAAEETKTVTASAEIIKPEEETEKIEEKVQNTVPETAETVEKNVKAAEIEENEKKTAEKAAEAEKQLEILNRQKEEAELEAQRAAQEAEKRLQKEKEALQKQKKETKTAQKERLQALIKLDEEKTAAKKAAKEAKSAKEEAERLKAELEAMKEAAALALAQKEEAEEAARAAREEKEKLDREMRERIEKEKSAKEIESAEEKIKTPQENSEEVKETESRDNATSDSSKENSGAEEKPIIKAVMEKYMSEKENDVQTDKSSAKKGRKDSDGNIYISSPSSEVIKRRIAEMEAQLSSNESK